MNEDYYGKVVKLSELFNEEGIEEIQQRIDLFQKMCDNPQKYTWKDKKEFCHLPKNKIAW